MHSDKYPVYHVPMGGKDPYSTVVQRAEEKLAKAMRGEARPYSLFHNNCERFARYCATGDPDSYSHQVFVQACAVLFAILGPVFAEVAGGSLRRATLFAMVIVPSAVLVTYFAIASSLSNVLTAKYSIKAVVGAVIANTVSASSDDNASLPPWSGFSAEFIVSALIKIFVACIVPIVAPAGFRRQERWGCPSFDNNFLDLDVLYR